MHQRAMGAVAPRFHHLDLVEKHPKLRQTAHNDDQPHLQVRTQSDRVRPVSIVRRPLHFWNVCRLDGACDGGHVASAHEAAKSSFLAPARGFAPEHCDGVSGQERIADGRPARLEVTDVNTRRQQQRAVPWKGDVPRLLDGSAADAKEDSLQGIGDEGDHQHDLEKQSALFVSGRLEF